MNLSLIKMNFKINKKILDLAPQAYKGKKREYDKKSSKKLILNINEINLDLANLA